MAGRKKPQAPFSIESYEHRDKERVNNPLAGLVTPQTDPDAGQQKKHYTYDPHLDPQLVWAGKAEHTSFEVPTVSLHDLHRPALRHQARREGRQGRGSHRRAVGNRM